MLEPELVIWLSVKSQGLYVLVFGVREPGLDYQRPVTSDFNFGSIEEGGPDAVVSAGRIDRVEPNALNTNHTPICPQSSLPAMPTQPNYLGAGSR
jgi:hypothetical protein